MYSSFSKETDGDKRCENYDMILSKGCVLNVIDGINEDLSYFFFFFFFFFIFQILDPLVQSCTWITTTFGHDSLYLVLLICYHKFNQIIVVVVIWYVPIGLMKISFPLLVCAKYSLVKISIYLLCLILLYFIHWHTRVCTSLVSTI